MAKLKKKKESGSAEHRQKRCKTENSSMDCHWMVVGVVKFSPSMPPSVGSLAALLLLRAKLGPVRPSRLESASKGD